jgi:AAA domain
MTTSISSIGIETKKQLGVEIEYLHLPAPKPGSKDDIRLSLVKSIRPCTELSSLNIPSRGKLLDDWFTEGDLGFIFAPRGLGKTWVALGIGAAIASGGTCGPWRARGQHRVLYIDGEMPCESIDRRIKGMGGIDNLRVLNHEVLFHLTGKVLNLGDLIMQEVLTELLLAMPIKVLILDNLSCLFTGVSENDADAWELVLQWLLTLRRHRIAVIIVHHSGRNTENMRGTSRREDVAFWVIRLDGIHREEREGATFISRFTKDRNSYREQAAIEWKFTNVNGSVEVATQPASSLDVFRQWIEDGLTSAEDIAREMNVTKGTASKLARKAMEQGWLTKNGRDYALV